MSVHARLLDTDSARSVTIETDQGTELIRLTAAEALALSDELLCAGVRVTCRRDHAA